MLYSCSYRMPVMRCIYLKARWHLRKPLCVVTAKAEEKLWHFPHLSSTRDNRKFIIPPLFISQINFSFCDKPATYIQKNWNITIIARGGIWWQQGQMQSSGPNVIQKSNIVSNEGASGVNFTNILPANFVCSDPKSAKRHWCLVCFLRFWNLLA